MLQDNTQGSGSGLCATATIEALDPSSALLDLLKRYYHSQQHIRRGVCLLNACQYDRAVQEFSAAARANPHGRSLPRLLAACHVGKGQFDLAAAKLAEVADAAPESVTALVRYALTLWRASRRPEAIRHLREGLVSHPDSAELHFQLGTLLAATDDLEEAEMRFTQAVAIDKGHSEALVSLGLCCAADGRVGEAKRYLERAQQRRPHDARVGLLLAQAAQSLADQGTPVSLNAEVPAWAPAEDDVGVEQLRRIVEVEPEFIDAFLALPGENVDPGVYRTLAETLNRVLQQGSGNAALHRACGQVLARLGRADDAIIATERALELDPHSVAALVQLAKLYQQTDRHEDAQVRLEQAIASGGEYADVYYLLGNLYRRSGRTERARWAYGQALKINDRYEAARAALDSLAA